ncbi:MAG TPA: cell division protein ZapA [bacterium]
MSDDYNILKVNIYGSEYPIKGSADIEYIKKVAQYVDSKMREVNKNISIDSSLKVSILAALNITDELFRVKEMKSGLSSNAEIDKRINKLNLDIETCLEKVSS